MILLNGEEVKFETFPNGETRLLHESIKDVIKSMHIKFSFKYENDGDLIKLMFTKLYWDEHRVRYASNELNIYYMPYSRMDRSENDSAFTLDYVTKLINSLSFDKVIVNEAHSDTTLALLNNSVSRLQSPRLLSKAMDELNFTDQDYIMFPDAGAEARYSKFFEPHNKIVGKKTRNFETGRITGLEIEGEFLGTGKRVIIIDDLSSYGGTFVKSAEKLREHGFEEVYLVVTHAENAIFDGVLFDHIDKVFTTDSILSKQHYWNNLKITDKKLQVYKMEELTK